MSYCSDCGGSGFIAELRPTCCGKLSKGGECRGDCAIPEEVPVPCPACGGMGEWPDEEPT